MPAQNWFLKAFNLRLRLLNFYLVNATERRADAQTRVVKLLGSLHEQKSTVQNCSSNCPFCRIISLGCFSKRALKINVGTNAVGVRQVSLPDYPGNVQDLAVLVLLFYSHFLSWSGSCSVLCSKYSRLCFKYLELFSQTILIAKVPLSRNEERNKQRFKFHYSCL